jgi:selT/selW/selH-like putative selenoprotein
VIKKQKGVDVALVEGARGAFEVYRDGQLLYSKLTLGRFPNSDDEVLGKL